jgi:class 3 adenylate cyclase/DNA-binding response OmpR family regulator
MSQDHEKVLVADDHRENTDFIIEAILKPHGFQVLTAEDGAEALKVALQEHPDLILLDLQMPKMHGLEVLQALQGRGMRIPVVLMTFHGSEEMAVKGFRLGARDYVIKPFTVQEMLNAIEGALIESRLRAERDALTQRLMGANEQLERRLREMRTLYAIGQSVTSVLDLKELLIRVLDASLYLSHARAASIILVEGDGSLTVAAERHREATRTGKTGTLSESPKIAETLRTRQTIVDRPEQAIGYRLFIPLDVRNHSIGVLAVQWPVDRPDPGTHYRQLLASLADYAAIAIENARGFRRLEVSKDEEKERILDRFQMYVAPTVVERILSDPNAVKLGGMRQEISILFADLHGFTTLSERLPPEDLVDILNRYLSIMASAIIAHEGTIDKFLADGLMAFFNAPLKQPDHAMHAAQAAIDLKAAIERFHRQLTPDMRLNVRMGINTGEAIVGNIGTNRALSYTAIGDAVNLAFRLEEQAEPLQILISESALRQIYDRAEVRPLGPTQVRGRQREERVFELLRLHT